MILYMFNVHVPEMNSKRIEFPLVFGRTWTMYCFKFYWKWNLQNRWNLCQQSVRCSKPLSWLALWLLIGFILTFQTPRLLWGLIYSWTWLLLITFFSISVRNYPVIDFELIFILIWNKYRVYYELWAPYFHSTKSNKKNPHHKFWLFARSERWWIFSNFFLV